MINLGKTRCACVCAALDCLCTQPRNIDKYTRSPAARVPCVAMVNNNGATCASCVSRSATHAPAYFRACSSSPSNVNWMPAKPKRRIGGKSPRVMAAFELGSAPHSGRAPKRFGQLSSSEMPVLVQDRPWVSSTAQGPHEMVLGTASDLVHQVRNPAV